ncbi:TetR family transcriptional regulator [Pseudonocardiaceae bacterium YIM PH 21723]|nr:TetR family transcriptional regulator [Pseudonocardiaceae bacterium YIM PH 21723]
MPKIVDPDQRRHEVAQAVFRVIERAGFAGASLRVVAEEAGLALGSVRHYFESHDDLMLFALNAMSDSISARLLEHVARIPECTDRRVVVEDMLAELLPVDEVRRRECSVWLEFAHAARTNESLRPHAEELARGQRRLFARILSHRPRLDLAAETERLCAVMDGLTFTTTLLPGVLSCEEAMAVIRRHLDALDF